MTRHPKTTGSSGNIRMIPSDVLISEIFGRVAAASSSDLYNLKLTCKDFNETTDDKSVYQRASLNKFPLFPSPWHPLSNKQAEFLSKCIKYENPEILFREAVGEFFRKSNFKSARIGLEKAMKLNHAGASFANCIVFLIGGDSKEREFGVKSLSRFKFKHTKEEVRACRNHLTKTLSGMCVLNQRLKDPPIFCSNPSEHSPEPTWDPEEDAERITCEACSADCEVKIVCRKYNWWY